MSIPRERSLSRNHEIDGNVNGLQKESGQCTGIYVHKCTSLKDISREKKRERTPSQIYSACSMRQRIFATVRKESGKSLLLYSYCLRFSCLASLSATRAIKAAPTPLPSLAIPMRMRFSPCLPMPSICWRASLMYSSKPG